jgi:hypothetical protein
VCGQKVGIDDGYVVWDSDPTERVHPFQIIHRGRCDRDDRPSSMSIDYFLGPNGLVVLTSMLSYGVVHTSGGRDSTPIPPEPNQFVDFMRRVQVPGYEEAREFLQSEEARDRFSDASEVFPYLQSTLRNIEEELNE